MPETPSRDQLRSLGPRAARLVRAALACSALVLVVGCAAAEPAPGPATAPSDDSVAPPAAPSQPEESQAEGSSPEERDGDAVPVVSAAGPPAPATPDPVSLDYARLGISLPVLPTGVADDGQMAIPEDAAEAGWYRYGPTPADDTGSTVIAAHAGSEQTPEGPLYSLLDAQEGDEVAVTDAEGTVHRYRVTVVEQVGKDGLDFTPYFTRTGPEQLVMVTCGGQWLPDQGSYADNIIVVAEPAD